ncbi:hypothetical protein BC938DRAFT_480949 [Jimgerdemannia flammicorona]|uniref:Uncharacterized protein n=1 Tax=Jimgerdemannia flammicorona TaxID=994334 RepID=A0A433QX25_9FUNG|nr:hypothetical protein BC938DRAFT_480949 [Jimgerdemannia flammicorona]
MGQMSIKWRIRPRSTGIGQQHLVETLDPARRHHRIPMLKHIFRAFLLLLIVTVHVTGFTPVGRYGQSAVLIGNTIYVYGGGTDYASFSNLYALDVSQPWNSTNPAPAWIDHTSDAGTFTVPAVEFHTMWPAADNSSIYIWGGGSSAMTTLPYNGFANYNVTTKTWSITSDSANVPQQRRFLSAAWTPSGVAYIWGGKGDQFTGNKNGSSEPTSDINILETRTTPFKWITSFPPTSNTLQSSTYTPTTNATSPPNEPNSVNNLGLIIGTACGALTTVITAIAIFLVIRKRGRKRAEIVKTGSEPAPLPYVPNVGQVQQANPHNTPGGSTMPPENCQPAQGLQNYQPAQGLQNYQPAQGLQNYQPAQGLQNYQPAQGLQNYQPAQGLQNYQPAQGLQNYQPAQGWHAGKGFPHSSSANSALPVIPLQYDYNKQPSQDVYANYQTNQQSNPYRSPAIPIRPTAQPPYYEGQLAQQGLPYTNPPLQPEKHHPVFVQENLNGSQPGDNTWRLSALAIGMPGDDRSSIVSGHKRFPPNEVDITVRESTNNSGNSNDGRFTPNEVDTSESQARNGYSDLPGAGEMDLGTWRAQHI